MMTSALLRTGSAYADDLAEDGVIYHYPQTGRASGGRDAAEIAAVRAAQRLRLPVFVVVYPRPKAPVRDVRQSSGFWWSSASSTRRPHR